MHGWPLGHVPAPWPQSAAPVHNCSHRELAVIPNEPQHVVCGGHSEESSHSKKLEAHDVAVTHVPGPRPSGKQHPSPFVESQRVLPQAAPMTAIVAASPL